MDNPQEFDSSRADSGIEGFGWDLRFNASADGV